MAIDPNYIPAFSLEETFIDKDTGQPLSGGIVTFYQDNQRATMKYVWQLTGTEPNYSFIRLTNPLILSSVGTFEDALGNPIVPYFFPYDGDGQPEYYYVTVESSGSVTQFVRESVPFIPGAGGGDAGMSSVITNELSNPQFSIVNFDTTTASYSYNFTAAVNEIVNIAPNWDLIVSSTSGTVTLTQYRPIGTLNLLSNPGTLLTIESSGVSALQLRQRLSGSPNLWSNGYISASFIGKTYSGTDTTVSILYSQSSGSVVNQGIASDIFPQSGNYKQISGKLQLLNSFNTQNFPSAYVDIFFNLPTNIKIDLTSVMVAFTGDNPVDNINYDQTTYARQIDQLYHDAYPVVPIGGLLDFAGFVSPQHYYFCDGSAKSRIADQRLFRALTLQIAVTLNSSTTFTTIQAVQFHIGMSIEGNGIPPSTTVTGIAGSTITISNSATISGASTITIFAWGAGDGSTTFNIPNLQGFVTAGASGQLFYTTTPGDVVNGVGLTGGEPRHQLSIAELASHTHVASVGFSPTNPGGSSSLYGAAVAPSDVRPVTVNPEGSNVAHNNIQPTALVKKYIRFR